MKRFLSTLLASALILSLGVTAFAGENSFADVPSDAPYASAIDYAVERGLMNGTSATTFDQAACADALGHVMADVKDMTGKKSIFVTHSQGGAVGWDVPVENIAAWPTDSFMKANDFTGKTVIPFCTSSSSGLGQSGTLLAELAGIGDWQEGQRFSSGATESQVSAWALGLGLN